MEDELSRIETKGKMDKLTKMFPMKRLGYRRYDREHPVYASDDSKWLTGNIHMIDGGYPATYEQARGRFFCLLEPPLVLILCLNYLL